MFVHTQLDEGNWDWAWCVEDLRSELSIAIAYISRDYQEPLRDFESWDTDMDITEYALGDIWAASSLGKRLLPIFER